MAGEFGTKKTSLSFGFSKKKDSSKLVQSAIKDEESKLPEEEAAFVDSFDGQQLNRYEFATLTLTLSCSIKVCEIARTSNDVLGTST